MASKVDGYVEAATREAEWLVLAARVPCADMGRHTDSVCCPCRSRHTLRSAAIPGWWCCCCQWEVIWNTSRRRRLAPLAKGVVGGTLEEGDVMETALVLMKSEELLVASFRARIAQTCACA